MATHDIDPVLQQLAQAVNESGQAAVPVVISVRGTILNGALISEQRYFSELVEGNPLLSALEPSSGLLGKEYAKEAETASGRHLHMRATGMRGDTERTEALDKIDLLGGWDNVMIVSVRAPEDKAAEGKRMMYRQPTA